MEGTTTKTNRIKCVELNAKGNLKAWDREALEDLILSSKDSGPDKDPNYVDDHVRIWNVALAPYQKITFHRLEKECSATFLTDGLLICRFSTGRISLLRFDRGDSIHHIFENEELVLDMENISEDPVKFSVLQFRS